MDKSNIIIFLCNWGPHTAFQLLQDKSADIPYEIKMVRIPCSGRINKSLLLKAFEKGADGVALVGCSPGACRYGNGTEISGTNIADTRSILKLLGLGEERLRHATFLPDETDALLKFLTDFAGDIREMGKTPAAFPKLSLPEDTSGDSLTEILTKHDVYACQDCGKCSSSCPLTLIGKPFSPRAIVNSLIAGDIDDPSVQSDIWSCLTCGLCFDRCPSAVNFPEFIRDIRCHIVSLGKPVRETHNGFFQSMMRIMTSPEVRTRKWDWVPEEIKIDDNSPVLFFGGCAPYFDAFFRHHLGIETTNILKDSLRLLNFFDIKPALLENERCCGHDLLWSGDEVNFMKLAALNVDMIHSRNIEEVVTACPECFRTLSHDYPERGIPVRFKVTHIYDFLEREIDKGGVDFKKFRKNITYQDSCRLSRFDDRADLPRRLIKRLKPEGFNEMPENGRAAVCCGNSAWIGCDSYSKALQVKRLRQSRTNGGNLLVTSCPKCQIHLRCAMEDPFLGDELTVEIKDLTSIIAETINWA
jgi:heterodisulfide reductase subunit D